MQFDFDRFSRIAAKVYRDGNPYSLEECLEVPHPPVYGYTPSADDKIADAFKPKI